MKAEILLIEQYGNKLAIPTFRLENNETLASHRSAYSTEKAEKAEEDKKQKLTPMRGHYVTTLQGVN